MDLQLRPKTPRPGKPVQLTFHIFDPKTGKPVEKFEIVHERLFHMFLVSEDLSFFLHDHPVLSADHSFRFTATFPQPGMYRVLSDFYPAGATPQLIARTVMVSAPGVSVPLGPAKLKADLGRGHDERQRRGLQDARDQRV